LSLHYQKWHQVACGKEHTVALGEVITSVEEIYNNINSTFSIHPNPASEYIEITKPSEGSYIKIYNILGESVFTTPSLSSTGSGSDMMRIDVSHLTTGVYYLRIGNQTQMFVKR
jgi:hypothetical protein